MTSDRPLGVVSDELSRRFDEQRVYMDDRFDRVEAKQDATNGRLREVEKWRAYMEGRMAGVGGSWGVFVGAAGMLIAVGSLALALTRGG